LHGHGRAQTISSAELVSQRITGINDQIRGLGLDLESIGNAVQTLVNELQSLTPPPHPGAGAGEDAIAAWQQAMEQYRAKVDSIRGKIDGLNARSAQIATRISQLQDQVQRLQNSDLPDAQRRDAERQESELKQMREQYEAIAKSLESSQAKLDADEAAKRERTRVQMRVGGATSDTSSTADQHLTLRVQWRTTEVKVNEQSDLKTLVRAFSVVLGTVGDGSDFARRANPAIAMPYSPGSGLPPIGTP
jgi:DNA repair exonuclease SbcCD ATPase subunit